MLKDSPSVRICAAGKPIFSSSCQLLLAIMLSVLNPARTRESKFDSYSAASSGAMRCCKSDRNSSLLCFFFCCSATAS